MKVGIVGSGFVGSTAAYVLDDAEMSALKRRASIIRDAIDLLGRIKV